jgi:XTP/dITP diphosphohydrolase
MREILVATGNIGKFEEIMEFLSGIPSIRFLSLQDVGLENDCEEIGNSFEENAFQKAQYFFEKTNIPTIGEDSGVEVDALKGELGIKTRRWGAGENASDEEWLEYFLDRIKDEKSRTARFTSCAVFFDGKDSFAFQGFCEGTLLHSPDTEIRKGIPLSSFFVPLGKQKSLARMSKEEKKIVSHRGKAIQKLREFFVRQPAF